MGEHGTGTGLRGQPHRSTRGSPQRPPWEHRLRRACGGGIGGQFVSHETGPGVRGDAASKPVAAGKDNPVRSFLGGSTGHVVAQSGVDVPDRHCCSAWCRRPPQRRTQEPVVLPSVADAGKAKRGSNHRLYTDALRHAEPHDRKRAAQEPRPHPTLIFKTVALLPQGG